MPQQGCHGRRPKDCHELEFTDDTDEVTIVIDYLQAQELIIVLVLMKYLPDYGEPAAPHKVHGVFMSIAVALVIWAVILVGVFLAGANWASCT
jgi:hypothetical protein